MQKSAKVTKIAYKKSFTGKFGETFIFTITFDNGDTGEYMENKNPQTYFTEGQVAQYILEPREGFPSNIKKVAGAGGRPSRPTDNPEVFKFDKALIVAQASIKAAVELIVNDKIKFESLKVEQLQATADKIMQATYDLASKYSQDFGKTSD